MNLELSSSPLTNGSGPLHCSEAALKVPLFQSFQLFGHTRSPSVEFKELTKRDAQFSLAQELDKLRRTGNLPDSQVKSPT